MWKGLLVVMNPQTTKIVWLKIELADLEKCQKISQNYDEAITMTLTIPSTKTADRVSKWLVNIVEHLISKESDNNVWQ